MYNQPTLRQQYSILSSFFQRHCNSSNYIQIWHIVGCPGWAKTFDWLIFSTFSFPGDAAGQLGKWQDKESDKNQSCKIQENLDIIFTPLKRQDPQLTSEEF